MGKNVLLVDDDEDVRGILSDYLSLKGFNVSSAEDGRAALEKLAELDEPPCFLLLDLMMPRMNGWEFIEAVKPDPELSSIPIFISTSSPDRAPEGYPVIPKPVTLAAILGAVKTVCDHVD